MTVTLEWYALRVRLHHERNVTSYLQHLGQEAFLPFSHRLTNDERLDSVKPPPLFTGYTFCRIDWNNGPKLYKIPGFIHVVGSGKKPIPILEKEIAAVRQIAQSRVSCEPVPFGRPGDFVRLTSGPLAGMQGMLERLTPKRVIVSVSLLRRSVAVAVEPEWLKPLQAA